MSSTFNTFRYLALILKAYIYLCSVREKNSFVTEKCLSTLMYNPIVLYGYKSDNLETGALNVSQILRCDMLYASEG
jgi:hypothetical protein